MFELLVAVSGSAAIYNILVDLTDDHLAGTIDAGYTQVSLGA